MVAPMNSKKIQAAQKNLTALQKNLTALQKNLTAAQKIFTALQKIFTPIPAGATSGVGIGATYSNLFAADHQAVKCQVRRVWVTCL